MRFLHLIASLIVIKIMAFLYSRPRVHIKQSEFVVLMRIKLGRCTNERIAKDTGVYGVRLRGVIFRLRTSGLIRCERHPVGTSGKIFLTYHHITPPGDAYLEHKIHKGNPPSSTPA